MAHYYFHLRDGNDLLMDPEGREVADADAFKAAALKEARAIISDDALAGHIKLEQRIEVEDAAGAIQHIQQFCDAIVITGSRS